MIIHKKRDDWHQRLNAWVVKSAAMPFVWGQHDCGLNAATCVQLQIEEGIDFAADFRGKYTSLKGGLKLLRKAGYSDHAAWAASVLPEISHAEAQIGDIVAVDFGDAGLTLMVVAGHRIIGPMPDRAGSLPLTRACRGFAVGRQP